MRSIGLDMSTAATGVVVLESDGKEMKLLLEDIVAFPKETGVERHRLIVSRVMETIHEHKPDKIVVEGYSLNLKNKSSVVPLVELGGIFRLMLSLDGFSWLDPRAGELKRFVMGNGNAKKDQMQMYVLHRWGHMSKSNDTADAYGLACMGLAHGGKLPGATSMMRTVIGAVKLRCN
jgi:Holliday junction resolvasome RuvABC endonuclease subunit